MDEPKDLPPKRTWSQKEFEEALIRIFGEEARIVEGPEETQEDNIQRFEVRFYQHAPTPPKEKVIGCVQGGHMKRRRGAFRKKGWIERLVAFFTRDKKI